MRTIAVTGTNGKTTTTAMVAAIVQAAGEVSARLTTVGGWVGDRRIEADTLEAEFFATTRGAMEAGVRTFALETTSKALAAGFATDWPPDVAVFTNLTRDHLDLHLTPEAYLAAKAQLFLALPPGGTAVLNAADPASELLAEILGPGVDLVRVGVELAAVRVELEVGRCRAELGGPVGAELGGVLELGVTGDFQVRNALSAALATRALGYPPEAILRGLAGFVGVPGRFQVVGRDPLRVVDYAHTPDGLLGTLRTARALVPGRVVLVFGCGGERDRGKRAEMGAVADTHADLVVLTTDNPRREDPVAIAAEVRGGAAGRARWIEEPDRASAIHRALAAAGPADAVIVAGKGHESVQEVAGAHLPFSDVAHLQAGTATPPAVR